LARSLSCKEFIDFLDDYLGGDQPAEVRAEFERHLAICPYCVDYLRTYESTVRLAGALRSPDNAGPPADAPEELIQAILASRAKAAE
jgi:anti-sigma factor RsiW